MRYVFCLSLLCILACQDGSGEASDGVTGDACQSDAECNGNLSCVTQAPAGYCTSACQPCASDCSTENCVEGCIPIGDVLCPEGGRCIVVDLGNGIELAQCLSTCSESSPCREEYSCQGVPDSELSVCLP
ncbi:MAG: hypothetical protein QGI45_14575 [Myxococcota bacterium]|nr:hypothetical protein [Myxococcota bacterium]